MNRIKLTLLTLLISIISYGQEKSEQYFQDAVYEICNMLEDKTPISFKRAVFLTENAYHDGQLDWNVFCSQIDSISRKVNKMIVSKGLQNYKTAGNWAIFSYMTEKSEYNNFCPLKYDFDNFMGDKDYESFMVSTLLKHKKR
ncbi:MAG: hypothetical protein U5Q03_04705 [Bacteroidota bacterium]|nr:hypothetical protein [Bacteroidota bacterium]